MVRTVKPEIAQRPAFWSQSSIRLPAIVVLMVFLVTLSRLVVAVCRYSVNLIYWDQWDFYTPLFKHASLWQIFTWEHSPYREGVGLVLDKFVLQWTRWNSAAEALFMVGALFGAAKIALSLKQKLFGRLDYSDCVIPCVFLTFAQMEALVGEENPSYSAVPEFLIVLFCLAWTIPKPIARYGTVLILNFLLVYTGFGLFMGPVTIGILLLDLRRSLRTESESPRLPAAALLFAMASLGSFFYHYRWDPAVSCRISESHFLHYPWFMSLVMSYFLGLRAVAWASVAGSFIALAAFTVLISHGLRLWRNREWAAADLTVVTLLGFTLLFAANAAIGRVCLGMPEAAQVSRYMGLLVPAFLGIYFHLLTWHKSRWRKALLALFAAIIIPGTVRMPNGFSPQAVSYGKQAWKTCILQTGNINYCDHITGFPAYPYPRRTQLLEKLQFLQRNQLNSYSGDR